MPLQQLVDFVHHPPLLYGAFLVAFHPSQASRRNISFLIIGIVGILSAIDAWKGGHAYENIWLMAVPILLGYFFRDAEHQKNQGGN